MRDRRVLQRPMLRIVNNSTHHSNVWADNRAKTQNAQLQRMEFSFLIFWLWV